MTTYHRDGGLLAPLYFLASTKDGKPDKLVAGPFLNHDAAGSARWRVNTLAIDPLVIVRTAPLEFWEST